MQIFYGWISVRITLNERYVSSKRPLLCHSFKIEYIFPVDEMPVITPVWKRYLILNLNFSVRWKWEVEATSWIWYMIAAEAFRKLCWKTSQSHFKNNWNPSPFLNFNNKNWSGYLPGILAWDWTYVRIIRILSFWPCEHNTRNTCASIIIRQYLLSVCDVCRGVTPFQKVVVIWCRNTNFHCCGATSLYNAYSWMRKWQFW